MKSLLYITIAVGVLASSLLAVLKLTNPQDGSLYSKVHDYSWGFVLLPVVSLAAVYVFIWLAGLLLEMCSTRLQ